MPARSYCKEGQELIGTGVTSSCKLVHPETMQYKLTKSTSDRIIRLLVEEGTLFIARNGGTELIIRLEPPSRSAQNGQDASRYELRGCLFPGSNMRCINHARLARQIPTVKF